MYQLQLMEAAAYLPAHSGAAPFALAKRPPWAAGEGSRVPNSGSQRMLVAKAVEAVAVEGQVLEPEGLLSVRWFQEPGHH